jgi:hypothetical protein
VHRLRENYSAVKLNGMWNGSSLYAATVFASFYTSNKIRMLVHATTRYCMEVKKNCSAVLSQPVHWTVTYQE